MITQTSINPPDSRPIFFLLDLEYLQAEFYLRALGGAGLSDTERGGSAVNTRGGHEVFFENPLVEAFVKETAEEERNHIRILHNLLDEAGVAPMPASAIDLEISFTGFARAAGLCTVDQCFDAFSNDTNLMLGAYIFEDVVLAAYLGTLALLADKRTLEVVAGIMAAEASHSAMVRFLLLATGFSDQTNSISIHRQQLSGLIGTAYQGGDHGVGTLLQPTAASVDGRSTVMSRSYAQCRRILCGNSEGKPGLFFPLGIGAPAPLADRTFTSLHSSMLEHAEASTECIATYPSEQVDMPTLPFDAASLASFDLRENVTIQPWTETSYTSYAPYVLKISEAIVHGAVGIVAVGRTVLDETLWHTDPLRHRYVREHEHVLLEAESLETLEGTTVSVLVGGAESYWHSLIDATARLILVPDEVWQSTSRVLLPSTGIQQTALLETFGLPKWVSPRVVDPGETFFAETLIFPSSLHGLFNYHPSLLNKAFNRLISNVPAGNIVLPKRIFIDRRQSTLRRLVNEDEVLTALPGYTPIRLETMSVEDQIRLFAQAEIIVAPHGAGLTNIGFARPSSIVVELMMDTYCNWCYRRLAALRGLHYQTVLGRSLDVWKAQQSTHLQTWTVDVDAVLDAVRHAENVTA